MGYFQSNLTGNPVTIRVDSEAIELEIWSGVPLYGVWDPDAGWTMYQEGYYKVVAN
jgi:hypothetical protein